MIEQRRRNRRHTMQELRPIAVRDGVNDIPRPRQRRHDDHFHLIADEPCANKYDQLPQHRQEGD